MGPASMPGWFLLPAGLKPGLIDPLEDVAVGADAYMNEAIPSPAHITPSPRK